MSDGGWPDCGWPDHDGVVVMFGTDHLHPPREPHTPSMDKKHVQDRGTRGYSTLLWAVAPI